MIVLSCVPNYRIWEDIFCFALINFCELRVFYAIATFFFFFFPYAPSFILLRFCFEEQNQEEHFIGQTLFVVLQTQFLKALDLRVPLGSVG